MVALKVFNTEGAELGTIEASEAIFAVAPNETLVRDVVVGIQSAQRQGTHKTKTRKEVSGGGVKPFRQKGTGRARQGSSREPQMRGGGTIFGPRPRDYRKRIPVRAKRQALCCVLSDRVRSDRFSVLRGLETSEPKTKPFAGMLERVAPEGRKTLLVTAENDRNLLLSARNIARVTLRNVDDVNAVDVLGAVRVIIQEEALAKLEARLS